ncbi:MAG TPA: site-2 protease family protein [Solirubrobacterales bacterium]|nr:site-2 protease family protein [Solirubrobacterales bacterium]
MNWLLIFLGFSLLVILHEAGHFFAAKATGMRVERFFLFFPPKLVSVKRGETEYGVGMIPAGGFVKISGMNPDEELPPEAQGRGYYDQPVWKRIVVIGAGPAVNIVLAFLILFVLALNSDRPAQTVGEILPKTPAAAAGLKPGDEILAIDGSRYRNRDSVGRIEGFREEVASHRCQGKQVDGCRATTPVILTVRRDGVTRRVAVHPEYDSEAGRALIGFGYGTEPAHFGPGAAASRAGDVMWQVASRTATVFARIFEEEKRKEVSGVVGVSAVANETIDVSTERSFLLLALVSLSLGLINLFPFLPLDGGHIFWSLVEKARGRPVPYRTMERAGALGFVLVIMLFFLGLSNDIGRLTGEGFNAR